MTTNRQPTRAMAWLGLATAVFATAGCAVSNLREAAELVRASEPFQAQPPDPTGSLLIVGDSTAVGTGASSPQQSIAGMLAAANPRLRIVNRAKNGAKYADILRQLQQGTERFDHVLVLGGANDVIRFTPEDTLRTQIRQAAELARTRGDAVTLMPPGNLRHSPFFFQPLSWWMGRRSDMLHGIVREVAQATGATYVDMNRPAEQDPFAQRPQELHAPDNLHPNAAGYRVWLAELERQSPIGRQLLAAR